MKILPMGAELFHADGRTDMTKITAGVPRFCESIQVLLALIKFQLTNLTNNAREIKLIQGAAYDEAVIGQIAGSYSLLRIW